MSLLMQVVGGVVVVGAVLVAYASVVVVKPTERVVVVRSGAVDRVLERGVHVVSPVGRSITTVPAVEMTATLPCAGTTADGHAVEVVVAVNVEVTDPKQAVGYDGWGELDAWKRALQKGVHDTTETTVSDSDLDAVHKGERIEHAVSDALEDLAPDLGVEITAVSVSEVREQADGG